MGDYGMGVFGQHARLLAASGITPEVARQRNYQSVDTQTRLASIDIPKAHRNVPGLLIPVYGPESANGEAATWQYRPDHPNVNAKGKPVKYVTAMRGMVVDVPPAVRPHIGNPERPLWITEGIRKVDSAVSHGIDCIGVLGVWNWRGTNDSGGSTALAAWEYIALNGRDVFVCFDHDVMVNPKVRKALDRFCGFLAYRKANVRLVMLPDVGDGKSGLDDYLAAGGTVDDIDNDGRIIWPTELKTFIAGAAQPKPPPPPPVETISLDVCHAVFQRWLGDDYDLDVLDVMLCALAAERLTGDPLWLLIISGPGAAKTETAQAAAGAGALVESTVSGEAALLSGTPTMERAKDATGGLLMRLGAAGVLVIKDVTSIISMSRDRRAEVLAALREIYDGRWTRSVGAEGGRTLTWSGRIAVIGAVTTAWDTAHSVVSAMGDRFVNIRLNSSKGRPAAFRHTMANTGDEISMRSQLCAAVGGVIAGLDSEADLTLTDAEIDALFPAADVVTLARTGVEYDYKGDVIDAHAPEMPTRFARQLQQIVRGGIALGMNRDRAFALAIRAARDTMPPVRLAIIDDLAKNAHSTPADVRKRINLPWRTVDRQCQALHMLGVITVDEVEYGNTGKSRWYYTLAEGIDPDALNVRQIWPTPPSPPLEEGIAVTMTHTRGIANSGVLPDDKKSTPSPNLLDELRARPDRCSGCGWHPPTQGHAPECQAAA